MSPATPAICLEEVTKVYHLYRRPRARLTASIWARLGQPSVLPRSFRQWATQRAERNRQAFSALENVSFQVEAGETVGIVGQNGSGKSTTLKLIAGTLQPTSGRVRVQGKVAALLELGSGFHQEFTGRENVFLSGAILGLSRTEIEARFDEIAAFADIGKFLEQPVKTYSSGMMLRLAFAVHTAVEPDILIIDEALSVGDEVFRRKCYGRLEKLRESGATLLFVSHDLASTLALTSRTIFFHQGQIVAQGRTKPVVTAYQQFCHAPRKDRPRLIEKYRAEAADWQGPEPVAQDTLREEPAAIEGILENPHFDPSLRPPETVNFTQYGARIEQPRLLDEEGCEVNLLRRGSWYTFTYDVHFSKDGKMVSFAMLLKTLQGVELGGARTLPWDQFHPHIPGDSIQQVTFRFQCLLTPGTYFFNAGVEGLVDEQRSYLDRVMDAAICRVLPERELLPTGLVDFRIEPKLTAVDRELNHAVS